MNYCKALALFTVLLCVARSGAADSYITAPTPPPFPSVAQMFKPGAALSITGSAAGLDFRAFRVEWARGRNPGSGWSATGVSVSRGGAFAVTDDLLATWDSTAVTESDYYAIRLVVDNTTSTNIASTTVYFERDLYSTNWPRWLDQAPGGDSALAVHAAAGSNWLALVNPQYASSALPSRLWSFSIDGSTGTTQAMDDASSLQPAVFAADSAPAQDLIVAEWNRLLVFHPDGSSYEINPPQFSNFQHALVMTADLNADARPEIIALGLGLGNSDALLYAWTTNAQLLNSNFPVRIPDADFNLRFSDFNRVTLADLDMDGHPELLVIGSPASGSFSLIVLRGDGSPGPWGPLTFTGTFRQLAVADLNHDGSAEIVLARSDSTGNSLVEVYSANGQLRPGWPVQLSSGLPVMLAVGDLDRDGRMEIVVTEYSLIRVLRDDGSAYPGAWPKNLGTFGLLGTPVIADVDGDGAAEIVIPHGNLLYSTDYYNELILDAYRTNGALARTWRLLGANGNQPSSEGTATVGDFDGDGQTELAINYRVVSGGGSSGYLHEGVMTVLRLGVPYRPNPGDWPMAFHDPHNTSLGLVPPTLQLTSFGPNYMVSWPRVPDRVLLEYSDDLNQPVWKPVTGLFILDNGFYRHTVQTTNDHQVYRLRYF